MRKNKTWEITLTDNSRLVANEPIENAVVYTTDTEAYLNFRVIDSGFDFDSATIAMLNKDDGSIVERPMTKEVETAVYEIESDIIPHFGLWQAQVLFKQGEEVFTSTPVKFVIERYMGAEQPPRLEDVVSWKRLYDNATETMLELTRINDELTTTNETVQRAEVQRVLAENERSEKYESYSQQFNDVIIELSEEKDYHSLPEIAGARGGFDTLGERLDETTSQLAQKVGKGNVSVSDINKNLGKLDQTFMSDELLQQIAGSAPINAVPADGSLTTDKYSNGSVTQSKVSFVDSTGYADTIIKARVAGAIGGTARIFSDNVARTAVFEIEPDKTYTISKEPSSRFRVATTVAFPENESELNNFYLDEYNQADEHENTRFTFVSQSGDNYLVVYYSNAGESVPIHLAEGDAPEHDFKKVKMLWDINAPNIGIGKNLFDGNYAIGAVAGSVSTPSSHVYRDSSVFPNARTIITLVDKNTDYSIYKTPSNRFRVAVSKGYPENNQSISVLKDESIDGGDNATDFTLNTGDNNYILTTVCNGEVDIPDFVQIEKGPAVTELETYGYKFTPHAEPFSKKETAEEETAKKPFLLLGDDGSDYEASVPNHSFPSADPYHIYGIIDDLMAENPKYITKSQLGTSTLGVPIYLYEFKMPTVQNSTYKIPKLFVNSGIHGHEKQALWGTVNFFVDLCEGWRTSNALRFLRGNTHILWVPLLNPDGWQLNQRKNGNGVDLNRNFPTGWQPVADTTSSMYSGVSAGSEIETQIVIDLLEAHPDIYFTFDIHNYGAVNVFNDVTWMGSTIDVDRQVVASFGQSYDLKVKKDFPSLESYDTLSLVRLYGNPESGDMITHMNKLGFNGVILEVVTSIGTTNSDAIQVDADIIGNFVLASVRANEVLAK